MAATFVKSGVIEAGAFFTCVLNSVAPAAYVWVSIIYTSPQLLLSL